MRRSWAVAQVEEEREQAAEQVDVDDVDVEQRQVSGRVGSCLLNWSPDENSSSLAGALNLLKYIAFDRLSISLTIHLKKIVKPGGSRELEQHPPLAPAHRHPAKCVTIILHSLNR